MKTLKYLIGAAVAVAMLGTGSSVFAVDDVAATKHNLSTGSTSTIKSTAGTDEVCVFCHTPHAASTTAKPLWNRTINTAGYTMYNTTWSTTIDGTVDTQPGGVSAACLSCHDGTIALDALLNPPGTATPGEFDTANVMAGTDTGEVMLGTSNANLGQDLTNDHPISITYAVTAGEFLDVSATDVKLYSSKVECGSCHNPHDSAIAPFLRISNSASGLCTTCHVK